jgi:hypothetical protein
MKELLLQFLIVAYAAVGIVATIGYIPTIIDLYFGKKKSANINSYVVWTICGGVAFLYSIFILSDLLFRIVSGLNFICCALILILTLRLEYYR